MAAVAELVLPFTAGLLLTILDAVSKHPAVAAVALCSLALAQPCLLNIGDHALKVCCGVCGIRLAQHGRLRTVMHICHAIVVNSLLDTQISCPSAAHGGYVLMLPVSCQPPLVLEHFGFSAAHQYLV